MTTTNIPIIELAEWGQREVPDLQLTAEDRVLAKTLTSMRSGRLRVDELRRGLRITASSWVGVVRFSNFEVRVVPKLAGHNLRLVEMIEFTSGLDALHRCPTVRDLHNDGSHLLDLFALLLAEESERILRAGLMSDYIEEEDELPVVRGRLLADRQFLKRFGRVDRVICRFDERKQDVPENQLLTLALDASARRATQPYVRRRTRQLGHVFAGICDPSRLDLRVARQDIFYNRLNEHYRTAHQLAWLILDSLGISDVFSSGRTRVFSFLLDMNRLFERFVLRVIKELLAGSQLNVHYQRANRFIIWHANKPYSRVVPDFLVQGHSRRGRLVLDAKYKLYDTVRVSTADVYQAFLYAYAFGCEDLETPTAGLVYPSGQTSGNYDELSVRSAGRLADANVALVGLPIPKVLDEMKAKVAGPGTQALRTFLSHLTDENLSDSPTTVSYAGLRDRSVKSRFSQQERSPRS